MTQGTQDTTAIGKVDVAGDGGREGDYTERTRGRSRYIPALDGLRTFAVLAVIFYHMGFGWAPGGLMGVTVFFVISGYLICGLLVSEHDATGRISLKQFWLRRVRRIIPAVVVAIAGTVALCALLDPALLERARPDIVPSLLFYNNWWQIFRDLSYFEAAGAPSPFTHFWSLAIEEQFYIVWPLLLVFLFRRKVGKGAIAAVVLVLAGASALEMALMYDPQADPSRLYYGTDTRAMSLLIGAWLAFMWPSSVFGKHRTGYDDKRKWVAFNVAGLVAIGAIVGIVGFTHGLTAFPYVGGIALVSALTALVIMVLVVPGSWLARLFSFTPFVWLGKRSYAMYLWHYPIILLTTKYGSTVDVPWWMRLVQFAAIVAVSAFSYTFIENPVRKGSLRDWPRAWREGLAAPTTHRARRAAGVAATSLAIVFAGVGYAVVPPPRYFSIPDALAQAQQRQGIDVAAVLSEARGPAIDVKAARQSARDAAFDLIFGTQKYNGDGTPVYEPLIIGDSIAKGCEEEFHKAFPYCFVDGVVSRSIFANDYAAYRDAGTAGDYVVFVLGTNNGGLSADQIEEALADALDDGKRVFLVNVRVPSADAMDVINPAMEEAAARHDNLTIVDWHGASAGHDEYLVADGFHPTYEGARVYVGLVEDAIRASL